MSYTMCGTKTPHTTAALRYEAAHLERDAANAEDIQRLRDKRVDSPANRGIRRKEECRFTFRAAGRDLTGAAFTRSFVTLLLQDSIVQLCALVSFISFGAQRGE